jgi:hypothetical protein
LLAAVTEAIYVLVTLSGQSLHVESDAHHPLLAILGLFAIAFACYLLAIRASVAADQNRGLLTLIMAAALVFRVTMVFSNPIEEIDLYRYLWDGQATIAGVSPFRFSPQQILRTSNDEPVPEDLARLIAVKQNVPGMPEILDRVHYGELPTIYPPTGQAIFVLATLSTPHSASVANRLRVMKAWFVVFDIATIGIVVCLLRRTKKPIGWVVAYAWCPLVIKEIANSGHLDSLAVFLSTAAIYLACGALFPATDGNKWREPSRRSRASIYFAGVLLGLAIGAKFYPVVLAPWLVVTAFRRLGWRSTLGASCLGGLTTAVILWPMMPPTALAELPPVREAATVSDLPPLPPPELGTEPRDPTQSLRTFLSEWEMNDFIFLLIMENVRPTDDLPADEVAWFSVVPQSWRAEMCRLTARLFGVEIGRAPFFLSRAITSGVFVLIALWLTLRKSTSASVEPFLEAGFLTLAWFWLLLPTQNPWYWTWAMPLLPFARGRAWLALSGLAMVYYFRFWLAYHFLNTPVLGTIYKGPQFFDYIVTWFEYGPWLIALAAISIWRRPR